MDFWKWFTLIGGIIGGVAFIMAVQPFTQFIWGRPRIEIEVSVRDEDDESSRYLDVELYNRPVKSRILKRMKIHRDMAEDVSVVCNITNTQTRKVYARTLITKISTIREDNYSVSLPGSKTPASITLIKASGNGDVFINGYENPNIKIIPGKYCLTMTAHCGEIEVFKRVNFFVGSKPHELYWEDISSR